MSKTTKRVAQGRPEQVQPYEAVHHPIHYQMPGGVEVIDLIENLPFNRGTAVKYLARAGVKPSADELEDLEKALWYVQREIDRVNRSRAA